MKTTVEQKIKYLEEQGYEVELSHNRSYIRKLGLNGWEDVLQSKGGLTSATAKKENQLDVEVGIAYCSIHDNYNKKIGANIALGRLIKKVESQ